MTKHQKNAYYFISITVGLLTAALVAYATSIGTNISTANLTVSGTTAIAGVTYTWPSADGSSGQFLTTDGSGTMSWSTSSPSSGGGWTDDGTVVRLTTISDSVGIGTTTPAQDFSVQGNVLISGDVTSVANLTATGTINAKTNLGVGSSTPGQEFGVEGDGLFVSSATTTLIISSTGGKGGCIQLKGTDGVDYKLYITSTTTPTLAVEAGSCQ